MVFEQRPNLVVPIQTDKHIHVCVYSKQYLIRDFIIVLIRLKHPTRKNEYITGHFINL